MNRDNELRRVAAFYESLTLSSLTQLDRIYAADAFFKDPFNEVRGIAKIRSIFSHMFVQVDGPRFVVTTKIVQGDTAFLTWKFLFRMKRFSGDEQCIHGASHLRFAENGLIEFHRDYWDAAEELYEKIPALGSLMRLVKRMVRR